MKYRRKSVIVEAVQYTGNNDFEIGKIVFGDGHGMHKDSGCILINTIGGIMRAAVGDWIVQEIRGEFYICNADAFEATYEKVE